MYIQSIHLSTGNSFSDKTNLEQYHPIMYVHSLIRTLPVIHCLPAHQTAAASCIPSNAAKLRGIASVERLGAIGRLQAHSRVRCPLPAARWLSAVGCRLSLAGCWLLAAGCCRLPATGWPGWPLALWLAGWRCCPDAARRNAARAGGRLAGRAGARLGWAGLGWAGLVCLAGVVGWVGVVGVGGSDG